MVLPRSAALRGSIRSFTFKRAGTQARTTLRGIGRRSYASEHTASKGSDIPWLIGSIVVTVPAAGWLWQQGPTPSDHGHGHDSHKEEHKEAPAEEEESKEEPKEEESKEEEPKEESKDDESKDEESKDEPKDGVKDESKDDAKEESKDDDKKEKSSDENTDSEKSKSSGKDGPKGSSASGKSGESEKKGDKDAQGDVSHSYHPDMMNSEKSKKSEGMPETAKIHGTVDTSRSTKGQK